MFQDLRDCYHTLELEPGASPEEVKRAFRLLVRVWHPDRFAQQPALQQKAQEKLKQINAAYEQLAHGVPGEGSGASGRGQARAAEGGHAQPSGAWAPAEHGWPAAAHAHPAAPGHGGRARFHWRQKVLLALVLLVGISLAPWMFSVRKQQAQPQPLPARVMKRVAIEGPEGGAGGAAPPEAMVGNSAAAKPEGGDPGGAGSAGASAGIPFHPAPGTYFTVGSTREEVLAVQGAPTKFAEQMLSFGLSSVHLADGRVRSWTEYASNPLKVRLLPSKPVEARDYFTVGSSRDEVLAVQGTPTRFTEDALIYGLSTVVLREGKVLSWREYDANPLRAKLLAAEGADAAPREYFTVGSTRDEVLAVQGTPTRFSENALTYGLSTVKLADGKVLSWTEYTSSPLKAKLLPSAPVEAKEYFTIGSSRDEVLAVQGSPTKFSETALTYGLSTVFLTEAGKVRSWTEYASSPLKAKLLPSSAVEAKEFFTVGSSRDEVLAVQGTPTSVAEDALTYGFSKVHLRDGKVLSWSQYASDPLKARLLPSGPVAATTKESFFAVGSTRDEVLAVQGTPTEFSETTLTYGLSEVTLADGKVVSWKEFQSSPLKVRPPGE